MELSFYNEGNKRYMSRPMEATTDKRTEFELRMLVGNSPGGLLLVHRREVDAKVILDYDVSGLTALADCDARTAAAHLYRIVFSLEKLAGTLKEYMLRDDCLLLDPAVIFFREEMGAVYFLYAPGSEGSLREKLSTMMEHFLKVLVPTDEREVLLLYGLYNQTREENVTLGTLAEFWRASGTQEIVSAGKEKLQADVVRVYDELGMTVQEVDAPVEPKLHEIHEQPVDDLGEYVVSEPRILGTLKDYLRRYRFECCVVVAVMILSVYLLLR